MGNNKKVTEKWGVSSYWCFLSLLCEFVCSQSFLIGSLSNLLSGELWHEKRICQNIGNSVSYLVNSVHSAIISK